MNISFSFPVWYVFLCVALGLLYAFVLYRKDVLLEDIHRLWKWVLFVFRFSSITILALLLLEPILESISSKLEKPIIVMAQDNSESLLMSKDSTYLKEEYKNEFLSLKERLGEKFDVQCYTFGSKVAEGLSIDFSDKSTNISELFDQTFTRLYNRNLGAIILVSDGIYNNGSEPIYSAEKIKKVPIYSIALGDTNAHKDQIVSEVVHNRLAYLGNDFPVEVALKSKDFLGQRTVVSIVHGGSKIASQEIVIDKDDFFTVIPFVLEAKKTGIQKYTVSVQPLDGELTVSNNQRDFYVDVLDSKQSVLILAGAPNPDIAAIKAAIERNKNYMVDVQLVSEFKGEPEGYSLIVGHQLPFNSDASNLYSKIISAKVPLLYILGAQTNFPEFNAENNGLKIVDARGLTEAQLLVNQSFSLFTLDDNFKRQIEKYPPLSLPFASEYQTSASSDILFYQKIGNSKTTFPLLLFNKVENNKFGFILGEGIWRWRMAEYQENRSHDQFDNFIGKLITYLASKEDKSFFRVFSSSDYREDEEVIIDAELYNRSYELVNDSDVSLSIVNDEGEEFEYSFSKTTNAYRLNCNELPKGKYQYTARVKRQDEVFEQVGEFSVSELKIEMSNVTANHQSLYTLSEKSGGRMFYLDGLDELEEAILSKKEIVDVSYSEKKLTDLINWRWICFLLFALLGVEWFIRKYKGAY